jgi:putative ABC transport system substrate-binding protein
VVTISRSLRVICAVLLAGVIGACSVAGASSPAPAQVPVVALMHAGVDHNPPSLATLVARLGELGWYDGSSDAVMQALVGDGKLNADTKTMDQLQGEYDGSKITLIWRNLTPDQAPAQAQEFVSQHVDLIVAFEDATINAAQAATADPANRIPVVFLHPSDPVRQNLVSSLSQPGGNLTGVFGARDPVVKQLQIYKQIMGDSLHSLLTLVDPGDAANNALLLPELQDAANQLGIQLDIQTASNDDELDAVFAALAPDSVDGVFILSPSLRLHNTANILRLSYAAHLPVQAHRKEWVDPTNTSAYGGALFSVGVDVGPVGTAGGRFVDAILHGTAPADLPVEEVPVVQFALNLKAAAAFGITVPDSVKQEADIVYQP